MNSRGAFILLFLKTSEINKQRNILNYIKSTAKILTQRTSSTESCWTAFQIGSRKAGDTSSHVLSSWIICSTLLQFMFKKIKIIMCRKMIFLFKSQSGFKKVISLNIFSFHVLFFWFCKSIGFFCFFLFFC